MTYLVPGLPVESRTAQQQKKTSIVLQQKKLSAPKQGSPELLLMMVALLELALCGCGENTDDNAGIVVPLVATAFPPE